MLLLNIIYCGKLGYCGHILRADHSLEKLIRLGMVKGKKRRERPNRRWLKKVTEKMELKLDGILNKPSYK